MESVRIRQKVGQDGILHLEIPVGLADRDVEVVIIYQPISQTVERPSLASLYGSCKDAPISVDDAGISESLDDEMTGAFD